ncbi:hypothetical protein, partial [Bacteroides uniformis]|uniref:hypothetical protein n=1 Tax=Bacteroides uniformis TaxID=820 RepID=UPI00202EB3E6
ICVAIAVLDIDNLVTDNIYARPVAEELFVGRFCIILLRFKKLYLQPIITQYFIDNKSEIWS